ncbi:DUF2635 domain-containing protein [Sneathiella sp.]|uniref:DUF2635 domain-containing protein n=1 Tax=Sneathiella sp. TaxID=1964365 RepID=UPI002FE340C7
MTVKFLRPNPKKIVDGMPVQVRDEATGEFLPASGKHVRLTFYWLRLLRHGDVLEGRAPDRMTLAEAIDVCLQANDDKHLTKSGRPDCKVLSALTGTTVRAADRDAEMAKMESN